MSSEEELAPLQNTDDGFSVILIAIDASAEATRVISTGARIARSAPQAAVHLAHVFRASRFDRARAGAPAPSEDAVQEAKEYLESQTRSLRRQCRNTVTSHLPVGDPVTEIVKLADDFRASLLVVGTHDHAGLERFLLGSVAETIVRKSHCSVVVVRPPH